MNKNKTKKILLPIILSALIGSFAFASGALAVDTGINYGTFTGLGTQDLRVTIMEIVRAALGFLGVLVLVFIVYGGFVWVTSAGNVERIETAKRILRNAVIGLVIVMSAFAIAQFVISQLSKATGAGEVCAPEGDIQSCNVGGCAGQQLCAEGFWGGCAVFPGCEPFANECRVVDINPEGVNMPMNSVARIRLNSGSVTGADTTNVKVINKTAEPEVEVSGILTVTDSLIEFTPDTACPAPWDELYKCFDANTTYEITILEGAGVVQCGQKDLTCGVGGECAKTFTTGDFLDTQAPTITLIGTQICQSPNNELKALVNDDYGVSEVRFTDVNGAIFLGVDANISVPPEEIASVNWDTSAYPVGSTVTVSAQAIDYDSNVVDSPTFDFEIRSGSCCNGILDGDETAPDCGGGCESCAPVIEWVSPNDGAPGNLITIHGRHFGDIAGQIDFSDADGQPIVAASLASSANVACVDEWTNNEVVAVVPSGASDGPIQITDNLNQQDRTNRLPGSPINDFDINTTVRPGLCSLDPSGGQVATDVVLEGLNYVPDSNEVYFSSLLAGGIPIISSTQIQGVSVPEHGQNEVLVRVKDVDSGEYSNPKTFGVTLITNATVSSIGSQVNSLDIPSANQYVGGAFVINANSDSRTIASVTLTESGTVNAIANLNNIRLFQEFDNTAPYDCRDQTFDGTESSFGSVIPNFSGPDGTATFADTATINETRALCLYSVLDVSSAVTPGQSLEISINNPSADIQAIAGRVGPSATIGLLGSTVLGVVIDDVATPNPDLVVPDESTYYTAFQTGIAPGACSGDQGICIADQTLCGNEEMCDPFSCNCVSLPLAQCVAGDTAIVLDGRAGAITIPVDSEFDLQEFTYGIWVRPQVGSSGTVLNRQNEDGERVFNISIDQGSGNFSATVSKIAVDDIVEITDNFNFESNTWYHLALKVTPREAKFFINGQFIGQDNFSSSLDSFNYPSGMPIVVGADDQDRGHIEASVDDISLFSRALTDTEILYLSQNRRVADEDLVSLWRFNEGVGVDIIDENSLYPGTLSTGASWSVGHFFCDGSISCDFDLSTPQCEPDSSKCSQILGDNFVCEPTSCTCEAAAEVIPEEANPEQSTYFSEFQTGIAPGACSGDQGICIADQTLCSNEEICDPFSCNCLPVEPAQCVNSDTAIVLDGNNGFVVIDSNDAFKLQEFTYEVWMRPQARSAGSVLNMGLEIFDIEIDEVNSSFIVRSEKGAQAGSAIVSGNFNFEPNLWHHLVLTATAREVKFFINGQLLGQDVFSAFFNPGQPLIDPSLEPFSYPSNSSILVGVKNNREDQLSNYFEGLVDDISLFSRALTDTEILYLSQNRRVADEDLVSLWRFNEGVGVDIIDENSLYPGTLSTGASWSVGHFFCDGSISCDFDLSTPQCEPDSSKCSQILGDNFVCEPTSCTCEAFDEIVLEEIPEQATYAWLFTTNSFGPRVVETCNRTQSCGGGISSPTPYHREGTSQSGYRIAHQRPSDGEVPVDSVVGIQFTDLMYEPSLTDVGNVSLLDCGIASGGEFRCDSPTSIAGSIEINACEYQNFGVADTNCINFIPDQLLLPNHWYQVALNARSIFGQNGVRLAGNDLNDPQGDYRWVFKTRNSSELSRVACLYVRPSEATLHAYNERQEYNALPTPDGFSCVSIRPEACTLDGGVTESYSWDVASGTYGAVDPTPATPGAVVISDSNPTDHLATVAAREHTYPEYVQPEAICQFRFGASTDIQSVSGTSNLYNDFSRPVITDRFPDCGTACLNGSIGATFSKSMQDITIQNAIDLYICHDDELCDISSMERVTNFVKPTAPEPGSSTYVGEVPCFDFNDDGENDYCLLPDTYYRVVVKGGDSWGPNIAARASTDQGGKTLGNLNFDSIGDGSRDSYSWHFKTKENFGLCLPDKINVHPGFAIIEIDELINYASQPLAAPDQCNPDAGQRLNPYSWNWAWQSINPATADLLLPLRDSCGNGVIEPGEDCDDGNTISGDGCSGIDSSTSCINEGSSLGYGSICGNNIIETGEDCDDGNTILNPGVGDYCDDRCLAVGNTNYTLAVCGNGIIEKPEQCDGGLGCTNNCVMTGSVLGQSLCGDGQIGVGEQCDSGELRAGLRPVSGDGDGCASNCLLDLAVLLPDTPAYCRSVVTNKFIFRPSILESDCGTLGGINCGAEFGSDYQCVSLATAAGHSNSVGSICGNLIIEPGEECDFGGECDDNGASCTTYDLSACADFRTATCVAAPNQFCDAQCLRTGSYYESVGPSTSGSYQIAQGFDNGQTFIQSSISSYAPAEGGPLGQGELIVGTGSTDDRFAIIQRWPNCGDACLNGSIGAQFNTSSDALSTPFVNSINNTNIKLYECGGDFNCNIENISSIAGTSVIAIQELWPADRFDIQLPSTYNPVDNDQDSSTSAIPSLLPNTYYRVVVRGEVFSDPATFIGRSRLSNLNFNDPDSGYVPSWPEYIEGTFDSYSWVFKTQADSSLCSLDRVDVLPRVSLMTTGQQRNHYTAQPFSAADQCSLNGQRLNRYYFNWDWSAIGITPNPDNPSQLINGADLMTDVVAGLGGGFDGCGNGVLEFGEACERVGDNFEFPVGCDSDSCQWQGSSANPNATCGNRIIESGEECDDGDLNTSPDGYDGQIPDYCSANCLLTGNNNRGLPVCGNGIVESGEQCDDGTEPNSNNGDGCTNTCIFAGALPGTGSLCGDGQITLGEECDGDYLSTGVTSDESCTNESDDPANHPCSTFDRNTCRQVSNDPTLDHDSWCYWTGSTCSVRSCIEQEATPSRITQGNNNWHISVCGNGLRESGEQCDDGNTIAFDGCGNTCLFTGSLAQDGRDDPYEIVQTVSILTDSGGVLIDLDEVNEEIRAWHKLQSTRVGVGDLLVINLGNVPFTVIGHQPAQNSGPLCRNVALWSVFSNEVDPSSLAGYCENAASTGSREACFSSNSCATDEVCVFESFQVCINDCSSWPNLVSGVSHEKISGICNSNNKCEFPFADDRAGSDNLPMNNSSCQLNEDCVGTRVEVTSLHSGISGSGFHGAKTKDIIDLINKEEFGFLDGNAFYEIFVNENSTGNLDATTDSEGKILKNISGDDLSCDLANESQSCEWNFSTSDDFCECDYIGVTIDNTSAGTETGTDFFTCGRNDCGISNTPDLLLDDDYDNSVSGNQHRYNASCYDLTNPQNNRLPIMDFNIAYQWSETDIDDIVYLSRTIGDPLGYIDQSGLGHPNNIYVTPGKNNNNLTTEGSPEGINGTAIVNVFAHEFFCSDSGSPCDPTSSPEGGSPCPGQCERRLGASQQIEVTNFICNNPWPDASHLPDLPYVDGIDNTVNPIGNFSLYYCRDFGTDSVTDDLPRLNDKTSIILGTGDVPPSSNIIKDIIFPFGTSATSQFINANKPRWADGYWQEDPSCVDDMGNEVGGCSNVPGLDFSVPAGSSDNYVLSLTTYNYAGVIEDDMTYLEEFDPNLFDAERNYNGHEIDVYFKRPGDVGDVKNADNLFASFVNRAFDENNAQTRTMELGNLAPGNYELAFGWFNDFFGCGSNGLTQACDANVMIKDVSIRPVGDSNDAIGVRVLENPLHLSPSTWYNSGFCKVPEKQGSKKEFTNLCFADNSCESLQFCDVDGSGSISLSEVTYDASGNVATCQSNDDCTAPATRCLPVVNSCEFNVPNRGSAEPLTVDGYQAIQDGRTVYVGAANRDLENSALYSNIYLLSYNQNASPETVEIFNRILDPEKQKGAWEFNADFLPNQQICGSSGKFLGTDFTCGLISNASNPVDIGQSNFSYCFNFKDNPDACNAEQSSNGCFWSNEANTCLALTCEPIYCTSDFQCPASDCRAPKNEVVRDIKRYADLRNTQILLENFASFNDGTYPTLRGGSFIASTTFSTWPSWQDSLAPVLGQSLPVDPFNRFIDCPADNPECWSAIDARFICPSDAYVYAYRSAEGGNEYELYTNFEYEGAGSWRTRSEEDFYTLPLSNVAGDACQLLDFEVHTANVTGGTVVVNCVGQGGDADGDNICDDVDNCKPDFCGNSGNCYNPGQKDSGGVIGVGDVCDSSCSGDIDGDGVCDQNDICRTVYNPKVCGGAQCDADKDGIGDVCDPCTDLDHDGWWDVDTGIRQLCGRDNAPALHIGFCQNNAGDRNGQRCRPGSASSDCNSGFASECFVPFSTGGFSTGISNDHRSYCIVLKPGGSATNVSGIESLTNVSCGSATTCIEAVLDGKINCDSGNCTSNVTCQAFENIIDSSIGISLVTFNPLQEDFDNDQVGYIADDCVDFDRDGFGDWPFFTKDSSPASIGSLTQDQKQHFQGCQNPQNRLMTPWL